MTGDPVTTADGAGGELDIRLFGGFEVRVDGVPLGGLRSARARSLLAFLVLGSNVAHSRQGLAAMFWPDSSDGQARTNLRNVLHLLRHAAPALDVALHADAISVAWRPVGSVSVDVHRFEAALAAVSAADPDDPNALIARCRTAVELKSGELLPGDLDDWAVTRRAELADRYRDALRRLATALIDAGRAEEATSVTRELVRTDPLDEVAHRLRIEAHDRAGDRANAIRAYHECAATLSRELDVAPDPATFALYLELTGDGAAEPSAAPTPTGGGHRLVGRQREWMRLRTAWHSAQPGCPTAVIVTGEAGVGKTRLVEELRQHCAAAPATFATARSYAGERTLGNSVILSWLRSPGIAPGLRELRPDERRTLARLLPELGPADRSVLADEAGERRRLFDAVARALTVSKRPVLLIADDAQWSDDASLELIHHVIRQPFELAVVVVLTARFEEVDPAHPLVALRDELVALERLTELRLERLPAAPTIELGSELMGAALGREAGDSLFAESEGNPLVITEMVRAGWDGTGPVAISSRLRAVIEARFRQLSTVATQVLDAAAVVARPCSAATIGEVGTIEMAGLVRGVDELWRRGILIESGDNAYEFSHGKLREAAYGAIGPARRRALHEAAAHAYIALSTGSDDRTETGVIAAHFAAAHQTGEAVAWLHRAALEAQAMFAYAEATQLLEHALALVPQLPADVRHVRELELLSALPGVLAGVDGYGTSRMSAAHARAMTISSSLGRDLEPAFVRSMVMSALCRDEFAHAAAMAEGLRSAAVAGGDAALQLESHYLLGISAFWSADMAEASRHFTTVVDQFDVGARRQHQVTYGHDPLVVCLSRLANTLWFLGRDDDAIAACDAALEMGAEVGHPLSHDTAAIFACVLAIDLADPSRLQRDTSLLGSLGMDSLPHTTKREALLGLLDVHDGRRDVGLERIGAALDRGQGRNFYPGFQQTIRRILLAAHEVIDEPADGLRAIDDVLAAGGTPLWTPEAHRLRAKFLRAHGASPSEVAAALDQAYKVASGHGADGQLRRVARRHAASWPSALNRRRRQTLPKRLGHDDRAMPTNRDQYDAIVVGARCAGAPTAMLLARRGHRVLLLDRSTFPSDTLSTLVIQPHGIAALDRWGLLEEVRATGCPPIERSTFDFGPVTITGRPRPVDGHATTIAPRRTVLDKILVDAAAAAGAEVREAFTVEEVVFDDGAVVGVRGRADGGTEVVELARVVIGADGHNSRLARAVDADRYYEKPVLENAFYTFWRDLPVDGMVTTIRGDRGFAAIPTNDGLTLVLVGCPYAQAAQFRSDVATNYVAALDRAPEFAERVAAATQEERFMSGGVPNFYRTPFGPGWVLVGDAGFTKDPITAQGICNAFVDAERVTDALDAVWADGGSFDDLMGAYQAERDAATLPMYEFTTQMATLEPPPPELQQLLGAIAGNHSAMDDFVSMFCGTMSPLEFFHPDHLDAVLAAAG